MIKLFILLGALFLALFFGYYLIDLPGMVIVAMPETVYEMKSSSALVIGLVTAIFIWLLLWLIRRSINLLSGSRNWLGSFSKRQQQRAFHRALNAYLTGNYALALKQVEKTYGGDFSGTNYMLAADLEARIHDAKETDALLGHAQVESLSRVSATIKQAQIAFNQGQMEKCLSTLDELNEKEQKQDEVLHLKIQALAKLARWTEVKDLISENKKRVGDDYLHWVQEATHGEFALIASKQGANALREKWSNLSRSAKKDVSNQICYVQLLLEQGLSVEAETTLLEFAKKRDHEAFLGLFKQLNHASPTSSIKFIEQKIKQSPQQASLYSVLAHLAYNSGDFDLAERAVNKALELDKEQQDQLLLAAILEQQGAFERANTVYRSFINMQK